MSGTQKSLPLPRRRILQFILLALAATVCFAARVWIIDHTQQFDRHIDLNIYRGAGALTLRGGNVYDPHDKTALREEIRTDPLYFDPWTSRDAATWEYYAGANLPGSTTFYGLAEYLSKGDPHYWRLLFAGADTLVVIAGLCWVFLFSARPLVDGALTTAFLGFYPPHLRMGTILPEDKQIQVLLMLTFIVILYSETAPRLKAILSGLVFGQAVMFKAVGVFLALPAYGILRRRNEFIWMSIASIISALFVIAQYGTSFVTGMWGRLYTNLTIRPMHSSIFGVFPEQFQAVPFRVTLLTLLIAWLAWLYYRGRIDLLNLASALLVCFLCISLAAGSIDRANMAILFSSMTIISMSKIAWRAMLVLNLCTALAIYAKLWTRGIPIYQLHADFVTMEAVLILAYVVIYFFMLTFASRLPDFRRYEPAEARQR